MYVHYDNVTETEVQTLFAVHFMPIEFTTANVKVYIRIRYCVLIHHVFSLTFLIFIHTFNSIAYFGKLPYTNEDFKKFHTRWVFMIL